MQRQETLQTYQDKTPEIKPIGADLVCPHCHLFHIWGDCGHWTPASESPEEPNTECKKASLGIKTKRKKAPKPWDGETAQFFAWREYGSFGKKRDFKKQRGFKNPKAIWYGKKDADYISVAKFKKGGAGRNRTLENFVSVDKCYSDIDAGFPLEWQEIIEKCERYNIPLPTLIVKTLTPNHYQPRWDIAEIDKRLLPLWNLVQEGLYYFLEELGADGNAIDCIRYLRNPNKCEKAYENKSNKTSLSVLYRALKQAGYIKSKTRSYNKWKTKFNPDYTPLDISRQKLRKFFNQNPSYTSTYPELAKTLGIAKRTLQHLCAELQSHNKLRTEKLRKDKTWTTRFTYLIVHIKSIFTSGGRSLVRSYGVFAQVLLSGKEGGLPKGVRNIGFFALALWLKACRKLSLQEIYQELDVVFSKTVSFDCDEYKKCVQSAYRDKYRYCYRAKNLKKEIEKLFNSLGVMYH